MPALLYRNMQAHGGVSTTRANDSTTQQRFPWHLKHETMSRWSVLHRSMTFAEHCCMRGGELQRRGAHPIQGRGGGGGWCLVNLAVVHLAEARNKE